MKIKLLKIGTFVLAVCLCGAAYAAGGDTDYGETGDCCVLSGSCTILAPLEECNAGCPTLTSTSNGITTTKQQMASCSCNSSTKQMHQTCSVTSTSYSCASGYYGTATSATAGCTKCPSNATCAGGNGSTFVCNKGYYKSGTSCTACESPGTTSGTGATSKSECCLSSNSFSDSTGSGTYTSSCCQS